mgnify:CR=1 FL=1
MRAKIQQGEQQLLPQKIDLSEAHREALARQEPWSNPVDLAGDFARAAGDAGGDGGDGGDDGVPAPRTSRAERR